MQALQNKDFYDRVIASSSQNVQNGYVRVAIIVDAEGRIISIGGAQDQIQALQQKIDANQAFAVVAKVKVDQAQDGPMLQLSLPSNAAQAVKDQLQQIETLFNQNVPNLTALRVQAQAMDTNMQALQSGALYEAASQKALDAVNIKNGYVRVSVIVGTDGTILSVNPSQSDMADLQSKLDLNQAFPCYGACQSRYS